MIGSVGILNVGAGDTKLSFDPNNPAERERTSRIVADMLKRGYCLLIEVGKNDKGPIYQRAHSFDENTCEYIIVEFDEAAASKAAVKEPENVEPAPRRGRRATKQRRIDAGSTSAVAVARTAGG